MNFFSHLECSSCGKVLDGNKIWNLCPDCGKPLLARYLIDDAKKLFTKSDLKKRENNLWRYHEMLPVKKDRK